MNKLGLSILLFPLTVLAQDFPSLSLNDCIQYGLNHDARVLSASLKAEIAGEKVSEVTASSFPQLNAAFDVKDYIEKPTQLIPLGPGGALIPFQFGTRYNATASLEANQLLFDGSYLVGLKASRVFKELSTKELDRTKTETAISIHKAYLSALLTLQRLGNVISTEKRLGKLLDDTEKMFQNGLVEQTDLDRVRLSYNTVIFEYKKLIRLSDLSKEILKYQMGAPSDFQFNLKDTLTENAVTISPELFNPALRTEYKIAETQLKLSVLDKKRYLSQYLPGLYAYGSLNAQAQRQEFDIFDTGKKWYPYSFIGARLQLPIFDGLQKQHRIHQASLTIKMMEAELNNLSARISLEEKTEKQNLEMARENLKLQKENKVLANRLYNTMKLKSEQGTGSNFELVSAEASLREAETNYYQAVYELEISRINYLKAIGKYTNP